MSGRRILPGSRIRDDGTEPDYRFSLANERTYLAYVRTSLAFFAAGTAVLGYLERVLGSRVLVIIVGGGLYALGVFTASTCYLRWRRLEIAMRRGEPLPFSLVPPIVAIAMTLLGVAAFIGVITH